MSHLIREVGEALESVAETLADSPLLGKATACWPTNGWYWLLYGATFLNSAQIAATPKLYRKLTHRTA